MGTAMNGWPTPATGVDAVADMSRQVDQLTRRARPPRASQILGPGIAPQAVRIPDWNGDETTFNGFYYSDVGALNTPDDARRWMGVSETTTALDGVQTVVELGVDDPEEWRRTFAGDAAGVRTFGPWLQIGRPAGSVAVGPLIGPWPGAAPGPTDGTTFTMPRAGWIRGLGNCTGYHSVGVLPISVEFYIDGVLIGTAGGWPPGVNQRCQLNPAPITGSLVTAGTHHLYLRQVSGNSNMDDGASLFVTITDT